MSVENQIFQKSVPSGRNGFLSKIFMANTYTQLYIQFVFAVQNRRSLIQPSWEEELFKYITGIVKNRKHKPIAVNGMPDHLHLFVGLHPSDAISTFMQTVKGDSSEWINKKGLVNGKFRWQEGYGAFSYSRSQVDRVYHYVMNQKEHHKQQSFMHEYKDMLKKFEIAFDERYIFEQIK